MPTGGGVARIAISQEGIFGTAVDVSATLIMLFTIYGALLQHSGAGKFYIDFSFAAMGNKPAGAGRTVVLASFLLGYSPILSVFWATVVTYVVIFFHASCALTPKKLVTALEAGSVAALNVAATCAAAITGGDPYKTTLPSWKYTLPAFLVPFMFVLDPAGRGILLKGSWQDIAVSSGTAMIGIAALAGGAQGWFLKKANIIERLLLILAGVALVYPHPPADGLGIALVVAVVLMQKLRD